MERQAEQCPGCKGKGCEWCAGLGIIPAVSQAQKDRINKLFLEKLAKLEPDHPWVKRIAGT